MFAEALRRRPSSIHAGIASGSAPAARHSLAAWRMRTSSSPLARALEDAGEQVSAAARRLPQLGHRSDLLVAAQAGGRW